MTIETAAQRTNTLSIVGFILSLIGLGLVGIILGIVALNQIPKSGEKGRGLAIAAIVIGIIPIVVITVLMLLGPAIAGTFADISAGLGQ